MDQDAERALAAEQRAFAVAKLRRAASLPRMMNGRRPPMHTEGVSEGEKVEVRDKVETENTPELEEQVQEQEKQEEQEPEQVEEVEMEVEIEEKPEELLDEGQRDILAPTPEPVNRKRRPRSRSRSRNSMKGKAKAIQSPTPSPLVRGTDSSRDDSPTPPPNGDDFGNSGLISPVPSRLAGFQRPQLLMMVPTPASPEPYTLFPGASPPAPMLPSLEAIQKGLQGLQRSNSAAARMMAMQKLTGGTETYDAGFSPSPTPQLSMLGRNNTVSGGERSAVRKLMLNRLRERIGETDETQTSASEELVPPALSKRRRRRSRKNSMSANTNPSEPELSSASPDFLSGVAQASLTSLDAFVERHPSRGPPATPSRPYTPQMFGQDYQTSSIPSVHAEQDKPWRRRSLVVDDNDPVEQPPLPNPRYPGIPITSPRLPVYLTPHNAPHTSTASDSTDSGAGQGTPVPVFLSATQSKQEVFPSSPFGSPLKEKHSLEDEEEVLYQARHQRAVPTDAFDREISWVAMPVPKLPLDENEDGDDDEDDDYDDEDDERPPSTHSSKNHSSQAFDDNSQQDSADATHDYDDNSSIRESKEVIISDVILEDAQLSFALPSPSIVALPQAVHISDDSTSPQVYPTRLSVASRLQSDRSPLNTEFSDYDESRVSAETPTKREKDSPGPWEKMKRTLSRNGSTSGRRSRTNSLTRERREQINSGMSRESGASIGSGKMERVDSTGTFSQQQNQGPLMMSPAASTSMMSVAPSARGGASPIPPATTADMLKYQSTKLFPFPGIEKLKEQRKRQIAGSSSTPDVTLAAFEMEQQISISSNNTRAETPDVPNDRKLTHQASDTRLIARFNAGSPQISTTASSSSQVDYFNRPSPQSSAPPPTPNGSMKLPMNRAGVKQWLSAKKLFSSNPSSPQSADNRSPTFKGSKKPSLSDLLLGKKESDLTDWEEISSDKSRTPTSATSTNLFGKHLLADIEKQKVSPVERGLGNGSLAVPRPEHIDTEKTPRAKKVVPLLDTSMESDTTPRIDNPPSNVSSPPNPPSSITPDPVSSLEDYPPQTTSESSSNTSSRYSHSPARGSQGAIVLERLDEMLGRGSRSPMWAAAVEDPPRKLLLSSPVLQVVNANTVKDRFLFLFSDLLVIAKPIIQDHDNIMDCYKPNPLDRKFVVKSVVLLRLLKFSPDREEPAAKTASFVAAPRNPAITPFVQHFAKDPEQAVNTLLEKAGATPEVMTLIGHLLFRTLDLDRARLGEYLSRRSSKAFLKNYVDEFGFTGMRVDKALRVFLLSLNVPTSSNSHNAIDYMADAFASRWYEANANIVAYDKDLAIRLVRAVVQLNEVLHGGITSEAGPTGFPKRNVTSRDFLEAFRRYDARGLVSDELLENVYAAIRRERLAQASGTSSEIPITIKRALPPRLTYRIQSEPIIMRIPQADPQLTIQLYGQDLIFDPPSLTFAKSNEASFRVTGTSLGAKKMIMWRSGSNALKYSGLPLSTALSVERAFMRNTFQVAFSNHQGRKRRYMFSVDDPLIRHQWSVSLKRQIDIATALADASGSNSPRVSKFHRAAEAMAFRVLQDTLIGPETLPGAPPSAIEKAAQKLGNGGARFTPDLKRGANGRSNGVFENPTHARSKSRSQVYHRHGAGKLELELNRSGGYNSSEEDENEDEVERNGMTGGAHDEGTRPEGRLWSGRDLELQCQQNSSIALVLAFLQVGSPDRGQGSA